jgi:hypothetical protein
VPRAFIARAPEKRKNSCEFGSHPVSKLYSQAIVQRALLRVLAELHRQNEAEGKLHAAPRFDD